MDDNITLADLLHVICTDIMNDNYKEYFNVIKNTKSDNIGELKLRSTLSKRVFRLISDFCYNGQKYDVFLAAETKTI